uniref:Uncharacterized protein n=1 Tax=Panagrolaimus sp. ES5 TaxID=591445 RepID=A0AC34G221_9BILA
MKKLGILSFEALFVHPQVQSLLAAVIVKKQNGKYFYCNMANLMDDSYLINGFPFTTRKRLLNCLQEGLLNGIGENGFISEILLCEIYAYCYNQKLLDHNEWIFLVGSNYGNISEFLEAFNVKEITTTILPNGELGYGIHENFDDAYKKVIKEKRNCYDAVKVFMGIIEQQKKATKKWTINKILGMEEK